MRTFTRRRFLAAAGATIGFLSLPALARARTKTVAVYRLVTGCGNGACACHACQVHDAKSVFPSWKAANGNRAHIGCNCPIGQGTLESGAYVALFGDPAHPLAYRADLRDPRTAAILKKHPPTFP